MKRKAYFIVVLLLMAFSNCKEKAAMDTLDIARYDDKWTYDENFNCYRLEDVIYIKNPTQAKRQSLNIYVPGAYLTKNKMLTNIPINDFTAYTAPILFYNSIGGYMGADPQRIENSEIMQSALKLGYVVVSPGARGREDVIRLADSTSRFIGKAPAAIVDLKAAVRYLRLNGNQLPGDENRIISVGTSAGGAMSALLGASGNNSDFTPFLMEMGAADTTDNIFTSVCYCPITDLENADIAYEWMFGSDTIFHDRRGKTSMSAVSKSISLELAKAFPNYVNSLQLIGKNGDTLLLDDNGIGSYSDELLTFIDSSANQYIETLSPEQIEIYLSTVNQHGVWLDFQDGRAKVTDLKLFAQYVGRKKSSPAFDGLMLQIGENSLFGDAQVQANHFSNAVEEMRTVQPDFDVSEEVKGIVPLMNPLNYIQNAASDVAPYFYIRVGTKDSDGPLTMSLNLALMLQKYGKCKEVNYAMVWDKGHAGDYNLPELFDWLNGILKGKETVSAFYLE